jgi:hypothetical protein
MARTVEDKILKLIRGALVREINPTLKKSCVDEPIPAERVYQAVFRVLNASKLPVGTVTKLETEMDALAWTKTPTGPAFWMVKTPLDQSIYQDFSIEDGRLLRATEIMAPSFRLNQNVIGLDKLGHFVNEGYEFFRAVEGGESVRDRFEWYQRQERGIQGYAVSGIFSYGDLAANFAGFLFWHFLVSRTTADGRTIPGLIGCSGASEVFEILEMIDWGKYFTSAWDEAVNRSKYATNHARRAVETRIENLGDQDYDQGACARLSRLPCAEYFLNPDSCLKAPRSECPDDPTKLLELVKAARD